MTPAAIIHWFLIQVLHGNTALTHVSLLAGRAFTASAFCQARARLPLAVFQTVLRAVVKILVPATEVAGLWFGHRVLLIDGSSFSMPDVAALQAYFGQPGNQAKGCGFPVAHILALFHADTGFLLDVSATPLLSHDMASVGGILPLMKRGDVPGGRPRILLVRSSGVPFSPRASLRYFPRTRCRSSTSLPAVPILDPFESGSRADTAQPLGVGLRPDGSSAPLFRAGAVPRVDEPGRVPEVTRVDPDA